MDETCDARPPRLRLRTLLAQAADAVFSTERGALWTFAQLTWRPARLLRRYLDWRDARITPPVRYFLVALAIAGLVFSWTGFSAGFAQGLRHGSGSAPEAVGLAGLLLDFVQQPEVAFTLCLLPWMGLFAASLLRRFDLGAAEALACATYLAGHSALLLALGVLVLSLLDAARDWTVAAAYVLCFAVLPSAAFARLAGGGRVAWVRAVIAVMLAIVLSALSSGAALAAATVLDRMLAPAATGRAAVPAASALRDTTRPFARPVPAWPAASSSAIPRSTDAASSPRSTSNPASS